MSDRSESPTADASERGDASDPVAPADDEADEAEADAPDDAAHLADVEDGAGCAEIWERLSERREREDASREEPAGDE
jgi:hypothetical protein